MDKKKSAPIKIPDRTPYRQDHVCESCMTEFACEGGSCTCKKLFWMNKSKRKRKEKKKKDFKVRYSYYCPDSTCYMDAIGSDEFINMTRSSIF